MITPKQADESKPDFKSIFKNLEEEMDERIKESKYSDMSNAFLIVEDYPEIVQREIENVLCPKYVAAGWAGATCYRGQHFHVHFTEGSRREREEVYSRRLEREVKK